MINTGSTNPVKYQKQNGLENNAQIPEHETIRTAAKLISERPGRYITSEEPLDIPEPADEFDDTYQPRGQLINNNASPVRYTQYYYSALRSMVTEADIKNLHRFSRQSPLSDEEKVQTMMYQTSKLRDITTLRQWRKIISGENPDTPRFECTDKSYQRHYPLRANQ